MSERVTIQDIADALGVSRNTVSKAINNTGILADATRKKVLAKAVEMGYKQFSYVDLDKLIASPDAKPRRTGEIALLSTWFLNASHFSAPMLDKFQLEISRAGCSMSMHVVRPEEIKEKKLPASLHLENCVGILCIEMFDMDYAQMLCGLGVPTLFVDAPVDLKHPRLPSDLLLMNNTDAIMEFVSFMHQKGFTKFGFIGEYMHCLSFFERYTAFRNAMVLNGLQIREEWNVLGNTNEAEHPDDMQYKDYLYEKLSDLDTCPEVFLCANDFVAIDLIQTLKKLGLEVPKDVRVLGFDDSSESRIVTPNLSTVHIHSQIMGLSAAQLMLTRISEPDLDHRSIYCQTDLILRDSTEGAK
jgi:LacI family transcriptional regulator